MDGAWLTRMRWRRRGAWMWPAFIAITAIEAAIGQALPPAGETETVVGAMLAGLVLNLIALVLLTRPLGWIVRRLRPDLPSIVTRDYAGTFVIACVGAGLLGAGVVHHGTIVRHRDSMRDAIVRAQAFIGDRAPAEFRANVRYESTVPIEAGSIYRTCVPSTDRRRTYCVIVKTQEPFAGSVVPAGYEPNASMFPRGTD